MKCVCQGHDTFDKFDNDIEMIIQRYISTAEKSLNSDDDDNVDNEDNDNNDKRNTQVCVASNEHGREVAQL